MKNESLELEHFGSASCPTKEQLLDVFWLTSQLRIDKSSHPLAHNLHLLVFGVSLVDLFHQTLQEREGLTVTGKLGIASVLILTDVDRGLLLVFLERSKLLFLHFAQVYGWDAL